MKKIKLNKITITRLNNLQTIKGGEPACDSRVRKSCTSKPPESDYFTEDGTL
ncbi:hypothetical protein [Aquimarina litoralis]|uniref:hypothetical protein n=1 Tax=Aquimarina litoralis TaxID=584605 RepID=UPI001C58B134|nr:hypothetical protein [Aquimarina litoralis]